MSGATDCLRIGGRRVRVECVYPPIPDRRFDFCAVFTDYEPGDVQGYGRTAVEAVADLKSRFEEQS